MRYAMMLGAAVMFLSAGAAAQVRFTPDTQAYLDPSTGPAARALFAKSGLFMIAGGVVLHGSANFYLERNGARMPVSADQIVLGQAKDNVLTLTYNGTAYALETQPGLGCPLGQFTARDGFIAYTIPKFMDPDSIRAMMRAGLVHHRIAREFDGTPFEPMLRAADFADTVPLQSATARDLTRSLNNGNDMDDFLVDVSTEGRKPIGSLINTDVQVRYSVFLRQDTGKVEISGVPLRYFWELDRSGAAGVFAVDTLAQSWAPGTMLTDVTAPGAKATQYDIINFYQVAGVFRQLHESNPQRFESYVAAACSKP
jgi:hypothetical protein